MRSAWRLKAAAKGPPATKPACAGWNLFHWNLFHWPLRKEWVLPFLPVIHLSPYPLPDAGRGEAVLPFLPVIHPSPGLSPVGMGMCVCRGWRDYPMAV
jgi:hypothetical protein